MKFSRYYISAVMVIAICGGCRRSGCQGGNERDDCYGMQIVETVCNDDSCAFASLCRYPIARTYPMKDIADSAMMVRHFNIMFDDSIKNYLRTCSPDDWCEYAWRGATLDNGQYIWCEGKLVYAINYMSKRELMMLDSLRREDLATLPRHLSYGWIPETCLADTDGMIYRIDRNADDYRYRLCIYNPGDLLTPQTTVYGNREIQGTASTHVYSFQSDSGKRQESLSLQILYYPYEYEYLMNIELPDSMLKNIPLKKTYWLDLSVGDGFK